jgi:hypothetical protein
MQFFASSNFLYKINIDSLRIIFLAKAHTILRGYIDIFVTREFEVQTEIF